MADEGADPEVAVVAHDPIESGYPIDVNQFRWAGQSDLHHGQETLAAGQDARIVAGCGLGRDGFLDARRRDIVKPGWEHGKPPVPRFRETSGSLHGGYLLVFAWLGAEAEGLTSRQVVVQARSGGTSSGSGLSSGGRRPS